MFYSNSSISFEAEYRRTLANILQFGRTRDVRGFKTKELSPYSWTTSYPLRNILTNKVRSVNRAFMSAEFLWILSGRNDAEMISTYNSQIGKFADNGVTYRGAYGPQLQRQLEYVFDCFKKDINTRQAIIQVWQPNPLASKDIPCTLSMQFLHDQTIGALDLIVTMRSNDAWLGMPYDVYNFTMILNYMAMKLGLRIGQYTHQAGSEHLYESHYDKASDVASDATITVGDIGESLQFETDELELVMVVESILRRDYKSDRLWKSTFDQYLGDTVLSQPWKNVLEPMFEYLVKKGNK